MSIRVVTLEEAEAIRKRADKYGECFEMVSGPAKKDFVCDNTDTPIPAGTVCAAVMILPSSTHPSYEHQKNMLTDFVSV